MLAVVWISWLHACFSIFKIQRRRGAVHSIVSEHMRAHRCCCLHRSLCLLFQPLLPPSVRPSSRRWQKGKVDIQIQTSQSVVAFVPVRTAAPQFSLPSISAWIETDGLFQDPVCPPHPFVPWLHARTSYIFAIHPTNLSFFNTLQPYVTNSVMLKMLPHSLHVFLN